MKKTISILNLISGAALMAAGLVGMAGGVLGLIHATRSRRDSWS